MNQPGDITVLLQQAENGDAEAANELFRLVQNDLRAIPKKRRQRFDNNLNAPLTMLVDDAFCRLVGQGAADWQVGGRKQFFSFAATKIHNVLVDLARKEAVQNRGGDQPKVCLEDGGDGLIAGDSMENSQPLLDLQQALDKFEKISFDDATMFRIRCFLDCTFAEIAEIMGVSETECRRAIHRVKLWLRRELKDYEGNSQHDA